MQLCIFLQKAMPYPRISEHAFWSVSAMPSSTSTNKKFAPRLLCVSTGVMEVFCVGYYREANIKDFTWSFINVASDVLFESFGDEKAFKDKHPNIFVNKNAKYREGGQYVVQLHANTQNAMVSMMEDLRVAKAAAALCLRVMRKRSNIYSRFHCPQLADAALHYRTLSSEELDLEIESVLSEKDDSTWQVIAHAINRQRILVTSKLKKWFAKLKLIKK